MNRPGPSASAAADAMTAPCRCADSAPHRCQAASSTSTASARGGGFAAASQSSDACDEGFACNAEKQDPQRIY